MLTTIFDVVYYGLSALMLGVLCYTAVAGFALRRALVSPPQRHAAVGVSLVALGALLTLVAGVGFLELARAALIGDLLYQQAHFALFYVGFGMILSGVLAPGGRWRIPLWVGFAAAIVIAAAFLFNPSSYTFTQSGGHVNAVQQAVFYLPLLYVTAAGALSLPWRAMRSRPQAIWLALFCAAILVGLLREAAIIPALGDPLLDLLAAFVPFTLGSVCLLIAVRSLRVERAPTAPTASEARSLSQSLR